MECYDTHRCRIKYSPASTPRTVKWMALHTVTDSDGDLKVFNIEHDDNGQWLNSNNGNPNTLYNPDNQFVCVIPRNYPCFSPSSAESFCNCFNQPPSCLPSTNSCLESMAYWVLLMTCISQASRSKNFKESSFLETSLMIDIFSTPFKNMAENNNSDISIASVSIWEPNVFLEGVGKCGRIKCQDL